MSKTIADPPRRSFTDHEIRSLRNYARVEGLDAALDVFEGLQEDLLALPGRVTDDPELRARILAEVAKITAKTAQRAKEKGKALQDGTDY